MGKNTKTVIPSPMADRVLRVRTTNTAGVLIIIAAFLYFCGFLMQNLAPIVLGFAICLYLIYRRFRFSYKLRSANIRVDRKVLSRLNFKGHPITVRFSVEAGTPGLKVTAEDVLPRGFELAQGNNVIKFMTGNNKRFRTTYTVKATGRGYYKFDRTNITVRDTRGLYTTSFEKEAKADVLVHTDIDSIKKAKSLARKHSFELKSKPQRRGEGMPSMDYEGVRDFQSGDKLKDVDWKATARLTKVMTKIFETESNIPSIVCLDCSKAMRRSVRNTSKFDYGVDSALQVLKVLQSRGHPIGMIAYNENRIVQSIPPGTKKDHYNILLERVKSLPQTLEVEELDNKRTYNIKGSKELGDEQRDFLKKLSPFITGQIIDSHHQRRFRGVHLGMQRIVKNNPRGAMIILISDLETEPGSTLAALKYARHKGSKAYVISPYSPWFSLKRTELTSTILEEMYEEFIRKRDAQRSLRGIGIDMINVGPRTPSQAILGRLRRYAV